MKVRTLTFKTVSLTRSPNKMILTKKETRRNPLQKMQINFQVRKQMKKMVTRFTLTLMATIYHLLSIPLLKTSLRKKKRKKRKRMRVKKIFMKRIRRKN
jgi:hypothetical protein